MIEILCNLKPPAVWSIVYMTVGITETGKGSGAALLLAEYGDVKISIMS